MSLKSKKHKKTFVENEFQKISNSIKEFNLDPNSIRKLGSIQRMIDLSTKNNSHKEKQRIYLLGFAVLVVILFLTGIPTPIQFTRFWFWWKDIYNWEDTYCMVSMPVSIQNAFMPRFDCNVCSQLTNVSKVSNLSPQEFTQRQVFYVFINVS